MSVQKHALYELPVPSTELESGGPYLCADTLRYEYFRGDELVRSGLRFAKISAIRRRSERTSTPAHIEGNYDTLVEVDNSQWLAEVLAESSAAWRQDLSKQHHYMIYLDGLGCLEVLAESWIALPEAAGSWPET